MGAVGLPAEASVSVHTVAFASLGRLGEEGLTRRAAELLGKVLVGLAEAEALLTVAQGEGACLHTRCVGASVHLGGVVDDSPESKLNCAFIAEVFN